MNNIIKSELQNGEFEALKDKHRVILRWATGCGKSKMAIDLVNYASIATNPNKKTEVAFIVAEKAHIKNWQSEFEKWGLHSESMSISILCYASLHKLEDRHFDVIVFDEAHHCFTERRKAILETITANYIYLLSATLSYQKIAEIEEMYGNFTISTVSLKDAISKDILPDPNVYIVEMNLDDSVVSETVVIGKDKYAPIIKWEDRNKYIYKNEPCIIRCTQKQKYQFLTEKMEYWKRRYESSHNQFHYSLWVNTGSLRKRFLGELKTQAVKKLVSSLSPSKRFICFCASVNQAERLGRNNTISSKKTTKYNQALIDSFNNRDINRLYAVGMANEGMNLTDIQAGIIVQLDGKERLFVQKFGRSLRAEDPVAYIFYFRGTQDEKYLKRALENIDEKFISYLNINQLTSLSQ